MKEKERESRRQERASAWPLPEQAPVPRLPLAAMATDILPLGYPRPGSAAPGSRRSPTHSSHSLSIRNPT